MSTPQFTRLAADPAPKCLHRSRVHAGGLQVLFCVKEAGHIGNHLHDVHPGGSRWVRSDDASRSGHWVYGDNLIAPERCTTCPFETVWADAKRGHEAGPSTGRGWLGNGETHRLVPIA